MRRLLVIAVWAAFGTSAARGQSTTPDSAARPNRLAHRLPVDPDRIHAERLDYRLFIVRDSSVLPVGVASAGPAAARDSAPAARSGPDTSFQLAIAPDTTLRVRAAPGEAAPVRAIPDASVRAPVVVDTSAHLPGPPPALGAARDTVVRSTLPDTGGRPAGALHEEIASGTYGGAPAWLLTRAGTLGMQAVVESLYVARVDLRPLHWSALLGLARLAAEFTPDTIFAGMSSPLGKQSIVLANPQDLLASAGSVDAIVGALRLAPGWTDSATVFVADPGGSAIAPATLVVEGTESVTVPAGTFDCWIVSLETERGSERLWVRKADGVVVRSRQPLPQLGPGLVLDRVLQGQ